MFPIKAFAARFEALQEPLDQLAADLDSETMDDLCAEYEDAVFMLSEIDVRDPDWREELRGALEEFDALAGDCEKQPGGGEFALQLRALVRLAADNAEV